MTCVAANNPFATGVTYNAPTGPLTVVLNADTVINNPTTSGVAISTGVQNQTINAAAGSSVTVSAAGADAYRLGTTTGNITATTGNISVSGDNGWGVNASSDSGTINITGTNTTTSGASGTGLRVGSNTGAVTVNTGTVTTSGDGALGVFAGSTSGNVTVNGGTVTTTGTGGGTGILASAGGAGTVTITGGNTTTAGANAIGVSGITSTGALTLNTGNISTTGANAIGANATSTSGNITVIGSNGTVRTQGIDSTGINAVTGGAGTVTITGGTVTTAGANSVGVIATTATGAASAAPLSVTTSGAASDGIQVTSAGGTATAGAANTTVSATGAGSRGIVASSLTGTTVNYGTVTANGSGVVVTSGAGATVTGTGTGLLTTTGAATTGVDATATGPLTVNVGRVSATGVGSRGIVAANAGGALNVTSTGVVANGDAVTATNTGGAANVVLSGTNNSVAGTGAVVNGSTTAALTLNGGTLNGAVNGAALTSATGSTVTNTGTITGTNAAIVTAGAGAATVNNNAGGTITGRVLLGAGSDVVNNAGTFNAVGDSAFGAGTNVFNNSGTLNVRPGTAVAGNVAFTGLTTFNNSGLIDLRNGHAGDVLALSGNYVGSGNAALAVDGNFGAVVPSDVLTIAGSATGTTAVTVNRLNTPAVLSTAAGTTFVDAGAGSSANAFVIAPGSQNDGVIQYGVVFDAATNNFALVSAPSAAAYRTSLFGDGVRNLWLQSADAWTAHMRELRDNVAANGPGGSGGRFWFQGYGNWEKRTSGRTVTFNGITSQVDLGYDQDYYGFQLGMDIGAPVGDEGGFNFGVTGGYQSSNMSFSGGAADAIRFNSVNGGLYASFKSGIFFVNALGKYDYYWGETRSPAGLYGFDINGGVWGAKGEAGLRLGDQLWVEPSVSVSWTNSDFDDFAVASGNFAIDDEDGLRGKAGARVGYTTEMGAAKVSLYGGANYVREFRGRSNVVFTSGGQTVAFASPRNADYVEGTLGVNIGSETGKFSGFFEGRYADGRDYDGYGVRGGVRVRF